jgi:integrase
MSPRTPPARTRLARGDGWIVRRTTAAGEARYLARWREPGGATRARTFATEAAAEAHLRDLADARGADPPPADRLTVADLIDAYLARAASRWAPGTLGTNRSRARALVLPDLGEARALDLTPPRVQAWIDRLVRRGLAAETVVGARRLLSGACREAVALGVLPRDPVAGTRPPGVKRPPVAVWTADEVRAVLAAVARDPMLDAAYRVSLSTGVRPGELLVLRWSDLDLDGAVLHVRRTLTIDEHTRETVGETTKGKRARAIALQPSTVAALRAWRTAQLTRRLAARSWHDPDLLLTDGGGRRFRRETWAAIHDRVIAKAGVRDIVPHGLRHTYATLELAAGTHPKIVADRLGHSSVQMTLDRYTHSSLDLQRTAMEALERSLFGDATTSPAAGGDGGVSAEDSRTRTEKGGYRRANR